MVVERKLRGAVFWGCMTAAASGCALPPPDTLGYAYDPLYEQSASPQPSSRPIDGCWSFNDNGGVRRTNQVELLDENTILVTPVGRPGAMAQLSRIGEGLFQDPFGGPATYLFAPGGIGVWRSNDNRNFVWRLTYAGQYC